MPRHAVKNEIIWCNSGWLPHHYGFCPSERAWRIGMRRLKMREDDYPGHLKACTSLFQNKETKRRVAVVTVGDHSPRDTVELLVHESMHVWRDMREAIGEEKPSSEFEAYAMQNIFGALLDAYRHTRGHVLMRRVIRLRP